MVFLCICWKVPLRSFREQRHLHSPAQGHLPQSAAAETQGLAWGAERTSPLLPVGAADHTLSAPCCSIICSRAARLLVSEFPHLVFHYCSSSEPCPRGHLEREYYHLTFEGKVFLSPSLFTLSPALLLPHMRHFAERPLLPSQHNWARASTPLRPTNFPGRDARSRGAARGDGAAQTSESNPEHQDSSGASQDPGSAVRMSAWLVQCSWSHLERAALWHPNWENTSS